MAAVRAHVERRRELLAVVVRVAARARVRVLLLPVGRRGFMVDLDVDSGLRHCHHDLRPAFARAGYSAAGTSSSSVSGSRARSGSSLVGTGPGASPRRLIQMERRPSSFAGPTSWNRLAATWMWPAGSAPVLASNSRQWPCAGL